MRVSARHAALLTASAALALASGGCVWSTPTRGHADLVVVASTSVWGDIAATIGGPHAEVTSLISSPAQDPHSYQPSARDVLALSKADVVIENGGGYDDFMTQLLNASSGDPVVLAATDASGLRASPDGTLNEHIWYDLTSVEKVAGRLATEFGQADPAHAQHYRSNEDAFAASLDALIARETAMHHRLAGVGVGVTEPVPLYMLDAIGAVDKTPEQFSAAVEDGTEVSVSVLDDTLRLYTDHQVAALVYNDQTSGTLTDQVRTAAQQSGVPVVAVSETLPAGLDYVSWMSHNLDNLDMALSTS